MAAPAVAAIGPAIGAILRQAGPYIAMALATILPSLLKKDQTQGGSLRPLMLPPPGGGGGGSPYGPFGGFNLLPQPEDVIRVKARRIPPRGPTGGPIPQGGPIPRGRPVPPPNVAGVSGAVRAGATKRLPAPSKAGKFSGLRKAGRMAGRVGNYAMWAWILFDLANALFGREASGEGNPLGSETFGRQILKHIDPVLGHQTPLPLKMLIEQPQAPDDWIRTLFIPTAPLF